MPKSLDSYKDKAKARAYRNRHRLKNYKQTAHAPARYERWSRLDKFLVGSFTGTDRELSFRIERSVQSIQVMKKHFTIQAGDVGSEAFSDRYVEGLVDDVIALEKALRNIEWSGNEDGDFCPACLSHKDTYGTGLHGHSSCCMTDKALSRL